MLIAVDTYTHSYGISGTGAAFLSPVLLGENKPSQVTRARWVSGTQTTSSKVTITDTVTNPAGGTPEIGAVAVMGVTGLPVGLKVVFNGDTAHPVLLSECPSGGLQAIYVPASPFSTGSVTVEFYNDVGGTHPVIASAEFEIGVIMPAIRWAAPYEIQRGWKMQLIDPSVENNSGDNAPYGPMRVPYRTLDVTLNAVPYVNAYGDPADGSMNLQQLGFALSRSRRCLVIPRWQTAGAIDQDVINALAIFGKVAKGGIGAPENDTGVFFRQSLKFRENPHGA